ncbi:hypothetical protein CYMTET_47006 [Cymbomonas tetramitiformis]|uniref:Uncharacterized protein n=1 Tax=Cymbomonas tetramitiformis TaxID=36881 RepID=A0AAE0EWK4_9CHLO|nr:hypothetical protein CYMTET_47006 [Cymbomonas tetramitiformis]
MAGGIRGAAMVAAANQPQGGFSIPDKDVILDRLNAVDVRQRPKVSRFGVDNGWIPQSARGGGVSKEKRGLITKLAGRMRELGCTIDHRERILKVPDKSLSSDEVPKRPPEASAPPANIWDSSHVSDHRLLDLARQAISTAKLVQERQSIRAFFSSENLQLPTLPKMLMRWPKQAEHRSDVLMERLQRLGVVFDARNRVGFVPETTGVVESAEILHGSDDQEQHHVDIKELNARLFPCASLRARFDQDHVWDFEKTCIKSDIQEAFKTSKDREQLKETLRSLIFDPASRDIMLLVGFVRYW